MKILIIQPASLGDFITTLPLIAALRQAHPGARIEALLQPDIARFALETKIIDGASIQTHGAPDVDLAVLCVKRPPGTPIEAGQVIEVATDDTDPTPIAEQRLKLCGLAGDTTPKLSCVPLGNRNDVICHLCLQGGKTWPTERWLAMVGALIASRKTVKLLAGRQELGWASSIARLGQNVSVLEGSLLHVEQSIAGSGLFIGSESGPTHMACALGVPTVAFWRPHTRNWRPPGLKCCECSTPSDVDVPRMFDLCRPLLTLTP